MWPTARIETDWFNFTALNSPENHPSRSMQDTFYVDLKDANGLPLVLRTHPADAGARACTSPDQGHRARAHLPGRLRRHALADVPPGRGTVDRHRHQPRRLQERYPEFLRRFFENDKLEVRFRPSFFPFTEPSAEIDMKLKGKWLEISGSGQVHPAVVRNFGLDPERYIGFAFGSGLERLTMLRYGIEDLRLFYEGDLRFLEQFVMSPESWLRSATLRCRDASSPTSSRCRGRGRDLRGCRAGVERRCGGRGACKKHPNADKLTVLQGEGGQGDRAGGLRRAQRARRHEHRSPESAPGNPRRATKACCARRAS